jgi:hypothetical protein
VLQLIAVLNEEVSTSFQSASNACDVIAGTQQTIPYFTLILLENEYNATKGGRGNVVFDVWALPYYCQRKRSSHLALCRVFSESQHPVRANIELPSNRIVPLILEGLWRMRSYTKL